MQATLNWQKDLTFIGNDPKGLQTPFDSSRAEDPIGSTPMQVVLEAAAACTGMDVASILQKRRKTITDFQIGATAEQSREHPRVFTSIQLRYELYSPDATLAEFERAIKLSLETYCPVLNMLRSAGADISWEATVHTTEPAASS